MMLEKMEAFFEARLSGYDEHMLTEIEGAAEFYPYTAAQLPQNAGAKVLDLGCGTGLELEAYFAVNPDAQVTGIDLSGVMLEALAAKFPGKKLELICGSYFSVKLGERVYDAAVSVESLHHFTAGRKLALYQKLWRSLKPNGCFVLTDYFAESEQLEKTGFETLEKLKREEGAEADALYHYDTPLTAAHETALLQTAGFSVVKELKRWGATCTILARR